MMPHYHVEVRDSATRVYDVEADSAGEAQTLIEMSDDYEREFRRCQICETDTYWGVESVMEVP